MTDSMERLRLLNSGPRDSVIALCQVRNGMGLTNLKIMIPFCGRLEEPRTVIESMARHG